MFSASEETDSVWEDPSMGQQLEGMERPHAFVHIKGLWISMSHTWKTRIFYLSLVILLPLKREEREP